MTPCIYGPSFLALLSVPCQRARPSAYFDYKVSSTSPPPPPPQCFEIQVKNLTLLSPAGVARLPLEMIRERFSVLHRIEITSLDIAKDYSAAKVDTRTNAFRSCSKVGGAEPKVYKFVCILGWNKKKNWKRIFMCGIYMALLNHKFYFVGVFYHVKNISFFSFSFGISMKARFNESPGFLEFSGTWRADKSRNNREVNWLDSLNGATIVRAGK